MKDLRMQLEMQTHAPYTVGLICSAYYNEGTTAKYSDRQNMYINCFRAAENKGALEAIKVMYSVNSSNIIISGIQQEMVNTLNTCLNESKEKYMELVKETEGSANSLYLMSKYQSFLFDFWRSSIQERARILRQDVANLRAQNQFLKSKLDTLSRKKTIAEPKEKKSKNTSASKLILGNNSVSLECTFLVNSTSLDVMKIIESEREQLRLLDEEDFLSEEESVQAQYSNDVTDIQFPIPPIVSVHNGQSFYTLQKIVCNGITYSQGDIVMASVYSQQTTQWIEQPAKIIHFTTTDPTSADKFGTLSMIVLLFYNAKMFQQFPCYEKYLKDSGEEEFVLMSNPLRLSLPRKLMSRVTIVDYDSYITQKYGSNTNNNATLYYCRYQGKNTEAGLDFESVGLHLLSNGAATK